MQKIEIDCKELLDLAKVTTKELKPGEKFRVKDLFRGFEWKRIPTYKRANLGLSYFRYVMGEEITDIRPLDKTPLGQQIYIKI